MDRPQIPLNALRAFEASARHLNFTRAAIELCVSQAALSHQIKGLEARLGVTLFKRLPRGVMMTDEGAALLPVLSEAFDGIGAALDRFAGGRFRAVLNVGVVGTFAAIWLLPRMAAFAAAHPEIDLRVTANNNRVDLAGEGLDLAIRFGDGNWPGVSVTPVMAAALTPMAAPGAKFDDAPLLRSYRADEWPRWFAKAGLSGRPALGPVFDSSLALAAASSGGGGAALLPARLFAGDVTSGRLVRLSEVEVDVGGYWLVRARSRAERPAMMAFRLWLEATV
ncbi:LysR family transcriptional regulator [Polymorphobacter glacialis]|uniref:LysR family transcriptional regulator n=1 Tax=Sandarakinorhabdus glacialis TaxID=1614636 RepID=A0A917E582_9SPHN|nr:LysR substrate-binding domain-containing protein [Polymorphobacter glacialis]GGE05078.1 LysR family transcriptional regulator [Polymorphobacter glacialis]